MSRPAVAIPEKLFFKIGEVCELAGVQAHVCATGNRNSQCSRRKRTAPGNASIANATSKWRCESRNYFYEDQYTIAGAKKRLTNEIRGGGKLKVVGSEDEDSLKRTRVGFLDELKVSTAETPSTRLPLPHERPKSDRA